MIDRSTVDSCLQGVSYPASKDEIVKRASTNSCPSEVVGQLRDMHLSSFRSRDDVLCHLGDLSACS